MSSNTPYWRGSRARLMLAALLAFLATHSAGLVQADLRKAARKAVPAVVAVEWRVSPEQDSEEKLADSRLTPRIAADLSSLTLMSGTIVSSDGLIAVPDLAEGEPTVMLADGRSLLGKIVVDALIGYSLRGAPQGKAAELIDLCNQHAARVLSLDVPSGLDATTGATPGLAVHPERTLTLALPKTGLQRVAGELYLADIGIPPEVYHRLGLSFELPFDKSYWIRLVVG